VRDWETLLSLRAQQLLTFTHILLAAPRFVFLDRVGTALGSNQVHKILRMLSENSITYVNNGEADDSLDLYDAVLEYGENGDWTWTGHGAIQLTVLLPYKSLLGSRWLRLTFWVPRRA
jgi:putative ATP-binding cassette transporter